jgi:acid phosphatase family membrane protein YuiD
VVLVLREHRFHARTMLSSGGMPSSHSALVTALTTRIGMDVGTGSTMFAFAVVFAGVVLYDAAGVRRAVSMQARTLNRMIEELFERQRFSERRLIELLGHTPLEVFVGALLGIVTALTFT